MAKNIEKTNTVILRCVVITAGEYEYETLVPIASGQPCLINSDQRASLESYIKRTDQTAYRDFVVELVDEAQIEELIEKSSKRAQREKEAHARRIATEEKRRKAQALERKRKRLAKLEELAIGQG